MFLRVTPRLKYQSEERVRAYLYPQISPSAHPTPFTHRPPQSKLECFKWQEQAYERPAPGYHQHLSSGDVQDRHYLLYVLSITTVKLRALQKYCPSSTAGTLVWHVREVGLCSLSLSVFFCCTSFSEGCCRPHS